VLVEVERDVEREVAGVLDDPAHLGGAARHLLGVAEEIACGREAEHREEEIAGTQVGHAVDRIGAVA